jgi:hypothetical protein
MITYASLLARARHPRGSRRSLWLEYFRNLARSGGPPIVSGVALGTRSKPRAPSRLLKSAAQQMGRLHAKAAKINRTAGRIPKRSVSGRNAGQFKRRKGTWVKGKGGRFIGAR